MTAKGKPLGWWCFEALVWLVKVLVVAALWVLVWMAWTGAWVMATLIFAAALGFYKLLMFGAGKRGKRWVER